jgi:O-antigen/teichoic acid export membrane protein
MVALAASRPLWAVLLGDGRAVLLSIVGALALALNVVLNIALLPPLGPVGASVASSIAYTLLLASYVIATRRAGEAGWRDVVPGRVDLARLVGSVRRSGG